MTAPPDASAVLPRAIVYAGDAPRLLAVGAAGGLWPGLRSIQADGLAVIVEPVPSGVAGAPLERVAADLSWLHERAAVVPLRACGGPIEAGAAERFVRTRSELLRSLLGAIDGCDEWSLRWDASRGASVGGSPPQAEPGAALADGRGYLAARRSEYAARDGLIGGWAESAERAARTLSGLTRAAVLVPRVGELAVLVPRGERERFARAALSLGCDRVSGPWPAQRYCDAACRAGG